MYNRGFTPRMFPVLTPTIRVLVAANVTIFIAQFLMGDSAAGVWFERTFGLVPAKVFGAFHIWQPVTYMFLHGGFMHILFNMLIVWMFGSELESLWGRRAFLQYYLTTGIGAGLIYLLLMPLIAPASRFAPLVGASGAGYGILMAYALLFPDRKVLLYFLIPIRVRWLVIGIGVLEFLSAWRMDGVGHVAHLGGLLFGYLYFRGGKKWLDGLLRRRPGGGARRARRKGFRVVRDEPPATGGDDEVNRILEKISREGLTSLTPEEQDILRRASRKN